MTEQNETINNQHQNQNQHQQEIDQQQPPQLFDIEGDIHAFIGQLQALADKTELEINQVVEDYKREALQVISSRKIHDQQVQAQVQAQQQSVDHPVAAIDNIDFDFSNGDNHDAMQTTMVVDDNKQPQPQPQPQPQQGKNLQEEIPAAIVQQQQPAVSAPPQATAAIQPMRIMEMPAPTLQNHNNPGGPLPHPPVHQHQQQQQNNIHAMGAQPSKFRAAATAPVHVLQQQAEQARPSQPLPIRQLPPVNTALGSPLSTAQQQPHQPINTATNNNTVYVQEQQKAQAEKDPFEGAISWFSMENELTAPKRSIFLLMIHVSTCPPEPGQPRPDGTVCTSQSCAELKKYLKELAVHKKNGCGGAVEGMRTCRRCIKTSMVLTAHSRICAEKACKVLGCQALKATRVRTPAAAPMREVVEIDDD